MKKKWLILIPIFIIVFVVAYIFIKQLIWNYKVAHAEKIVELARNDVYVYSDMRISKLIKSINGDLDTNPKIDTTKLGPQKVKFKYTTFEGYPVSYEVEIEVVDVTPPEIFSTKAKTIYTNFEGNLEEHLFCGDNYDPEPKCTIEGEYDTKTPGSYDIKFIGEDASGNRKENSFTLNVKNPPKSTSAVDESNAIKFSELKEKYAGDNVKFGIDVSQHQGDIDFQKVKDAGVEFVYIRVGRGGGVGKEPVMDKKFEQNIKGFNSVGIPVGIYFYSYAINQKETVRDAKWVVEQLKKYKVDLEVAYDFEDWNDYQEYKLSFYELTQVANSFNNYMEKNGYEGMLYGSKYYLRDIWFKQEYPVWLAHYTTQTDYQDSYRVWQLSDEGKVPGIDGLVDLNIRYE